MFQSRLLEMLDDESIVILCMYLNITASRSKFGKQDYWINTLRVNP